MSTNGNRPQPRATEESGIAAAMLELLCCPLTKGRLRWDPERKELVSDAARLAYPVRDGVPVMLPSEARQLDFDEKEG